MNSTTLLQLNKLLQYFIAPYEIRKFYNSKTDKFGKAKIRAPHELKTPEAKKYASAIKRELLEALGIENDPKYFASELEANMKIIKELITAVYTKAEIQEFLSHNKYLQENF